MLLPFLISVVRCVILFKGILKWLTLCVKWLLYIGSFCNRNCLDNPLFLLTSVWFLIYIYFVFWYFCVSLGFSCSPTNSQTVLSKFATNFSYYRLYVILTIKICDVHDEQKNVEITMWKRLLYGCESVINLNLTKY